MNFFLNISWLFVIYTCRCTLSFQVRSPLSFRKLERQPKGKFFPPVASRPLSHHGNQSPDLGRIFALFLSGENGDNMEKGPWDSEEPQIIVRGSDADDIDGSIWEDLETGEPPQWMVMKELLGINIFTYILGALIVFFLSMNFFLGPGWLGNVIGLEGTGSIKEVSESLPDALDASSPEFRL